MKRYTHAWIALRAIDRLGKLADGILQDAEKPANAENLKASRENNLKKREKIKKDAAKAFRIEQDKYDSIKSLQALLRDPEKVKLVVQGTWIPDNVIADNREGHIWKYEPPLLKGEERVYQKDGKNYKGYIVKTRGKNLWYRADHAKTKSLCYEEAQNTFAWNKPWRKASGFLADRCEAVHQTVRDMFLYQEDEMHKLAATLIVKYGDDFLSKQQEVEAFLAEPNTVKAYYDGDGNVHRKAIINLRNQIGKDDAIDQRVQDCMQLYREQIKEYITKANGLNFSKGKSPFFPMFFTDDQIILSLFTLSHYLSDAHMPLHADSRGFSDEKCGNVHGLVEEEWENWVVSKKDQIYLKDILSESERAQRFLERCFAKKDTTWNNFQYPDESLLEKFDQELGSCIWEDREIEMNQNSSLWDETVGITYASYCLAGRLLAFNDTTRTVPKGSREKYCIDFDNVREVSKGDWKITCDSVRDVEIPVKAELRKRIYVFAASQGEADVAFNYLSLLILVDAVDCVARAWGKIVKDHLDVTCQRK